MDTATAGRKLREARFFLDRLKEVRRFPRSEEFGHSLSAFLGGARSVMLFEIAGGCKSRKRGTNHHDVKARRRGQRISTALACGAAS